MKILHIYKTYYPETFGGCETFIQALSDITEKLGCENTLLTTTQTKNRSSKKLGALCVEYFPANFTAASCPLSVSLFREFKRYADVADVIHYHFPWPFADLLQLLHHPNKPTLVTYQSDIVRQRLLKIFYQPLMTRFLKKMDRTVVTSDNYQKSSPVLQEFTDRCVNIPNGIEDPTQQTVEPQVLSNWQTKVGSGFLLFVGVLRYYKGLQFLLEAVAETNIPVVIAGSGPMENELKTQAETLKLKNVCFTGFISDQDKNALYQLSKAIVMPSHLRSEAFGISLLEGAAFGKPLISCEMGTGTSFINETGVTGLTVPPADAPALRSAIETIMTDAALCKKFGKAARARYEALFTAEKVGKAYFDLYENLISSRIAPP